MSEQKRSIFKNFEIVATLGIIPKHVYQDPKAKLNKTLVGSGPYKISQYLFGKMIILTKNTSWHGVNIPVNKSKWNFKNIAIRFISEETNKLLRLQKEDIDYSNLQAESFENKTSKPPWGDRVFKHKVKNKSAKGYGFIGFNFKNMLFKDVASKTSLSPAL